MHNSFSVDFGPVFELLSPGLFSLSAMLLCIVKICGSVASDVVLVSFSHAVSGAHMPLL